MADDSKKLDYIQERVDTLVDRVSDVKHDVVELKTSLEHQDKRVERMEAAHARTTEIMSENTESLKEHMRRTNLLEEYQRSMDARFSPLELEQLRKKAVRSWISTNAKLVGKISAALTAGAAIGATLMKLAHFLFVS